MEWMPIETAPKDGRYIELRPAPTEDTAEGRWDNNYGGLWYLKGVGHLNGIWKPKEWREIELDPGDDDNYLMYR